MRHCPKKEDSMRRNGGIFRCSHILVGGVLSGHGGARTGGNDVSRRIQGDARTRLD